MDKFEQGNIKLMQVDCMEYMRTVPDKYFDLAIVDPPYGINVNVSMGRRKGNKKSDYHKFAGGDKEPPKKEYFAELERVSKNQIIWGANHFIDFMFGEVNSPCWVMWDKGFSEDVTFAQFELAWTSFKTTCKKFDKSPNDKYRIHPTQKPVKLYQWLLQNYAKPEHKILDTYLGSGSHAIAAHYYGIAEFVGCELDPDYFAASCKRIATETAQESLF
jgi:site-specific DNA-methyltransferase (adenine-specific)